MAGSGGIRKDLKVPQVVGKFGRVLWFWRAPEQASEGPVRTANICTVLVILTGCHLTVGDATWALLGMPPGLCWGCHLSSFYVFGPSKLVFSLLAQEISFATSVS